MQEYSYDKAELIRRRAAAEKILSENKDLTKAQKDYFVKVIQESDSKLAGTYREPIQTDEPSKGLNIIAFLFPLIGLILYLVFMDSCPKKARDIGSWALGGFFLSMLFAPFVFFM